MVEVIYDLLFGEIDDGDVTEEEFAKQCRVFVMVIPELLAIAS